MSHGLTRNEVYQFRLMAAYPHIVERVIAQSNDDDPPSRSKVLRAIREEQGRVSRPGAVALRQGIARLIEAHGADEFLGAVLASFASDAAVTA